jgi:hypothetical protein
MRPASSLTQLWPLQRRGQPVEQVFENFPAVDFFQHFMPSAGTEIMTNILEAPLGVVGIFFLRYPAEPKHVFHQQLEAALAEISKSALEGSLRPCAR